MLKSLPNCYLGALQLMILAALAFASPVSYGQDAVTQLIALSGLQAQLEESPAEGAKAFADEFRKSSQMDMGSDFEAMVHRVLSEQNAVANIKAALSKNLSARHVKKLLAWYESDIGREVTALEVAIGSPEQIERMMAQMNSLLADAGKMQRAKRLDALLGLTDLTMHSMEVTQMALVSAILAGENTPQAIRESVMAQTKAGIADSRPQMEQFTMAMSAYAYRALSDAQFDAYLRFLETPESQRFHEISIRATNEAVTRTYATLGQEIQERLSRLQQSVAQAERTTL